MHFRFKIMLIYIAGIPGVGKSTIINNLINKLNISGYRTISIRGLPILCKLAGGILPEEFRKLPDNIRDKYRPEMFKEIYEEDQNDPKTIRILDGHFAYYEVNSKEYSIRPIQKGDYGQMKAIFVITSETENVLKRRKQDINERTDRSLDLDYIKEQEGIEEDEAVKQAKELNIPVSFVSNDNGISNAVDKIYSEFKRLSLVPNEIINSIKNEIKFK